jgi:hypothetical protein
MVELKIGLCIVGAAAVARPGGEIATKQLLEIDDKLIKTVTRYLNGYCLVTRASFDVILPSY